MAQCELERPKERLLHIGGFGQTLGSHEGMLIAQLASKPLHSVFRFYCISDVRRLKINLTSSGQMKSTNLQLAHACLNS